MRVLLDECLPARLRKFLPGHEVSTVPGMGWQGLKDGALLARAEGEFDLFVTADTNLRYQQTLSRYSLAVLVIHARTNRLEDIMPLLPQIQERLSSVTKGSIQIVAA